MPSFSSAITLRCQKRPGESNAPAGHPVAPVSGRSVKSLMPGLIRLKEWRLTKALTQRELANLAGVDSVDRGAD